MIQRKFVILLATTMLFSGCVGWNEPSSPFYGAEVEQGDVPSFTLDSHDGTVFNSTDLEGKVVIVGFIYTRCPDICPITSQNIAYVHSLISAEHDDVAVISITVDPWADDPATLSEYVVDQNLSWPHLTGLVEDMEPVWKAFGVGLTTYDDDSDGDGVVDGFDICPETPTNEATDHHGCGLDTQEGEEDNATAGSGTSGRHALPGYWVDHMTGTVILDRDMQQRVFWGDMDWNPDFVIQDVKTLLAE